MLIQRCLSAGGDGQVLSAVRAFGGQLEDVEQVEEGQRGLGDDQLELLVQVCGGEGVGVGVGDMWSVVEENWARCVERCGRGVGEV